MNFKEALSLALLKLPIIGDFIHSMAMKILINAYFRKQEKLWQPPILCPRYPIMCWKCDDKSCELAGKHERVRYGK